VAALFATLPDTDVPVRTAFLSLAACIPDRQAQNDILFHIALTDTDRTVRCAAVSQLTVTPALAMHPLVFQPLNDPSTRVRRAPDEDLREGHLLVEAIARFGKACEPRLGAILNVFTNHLNRINI
jgi:hypothetical protein